MRTLKLTGILICCMIYSDLSSAQVKDSTIDIKQVVKRTRDTYKQYSLEKPGVFKKLVIGDSSEEYSKTDSSNAIAEVVVDGPVINGARRQTSYWFLNKRLFQVYVRVIKENIAVAFGNYFFSDDNLYYKYEESLPPNDPSILVEQAKMYFSKGKQLLLEYKKP